MVTNIVLIAKNRPDLTKQTIDTLYRNTDLAQFNLTIIDDDSDCMVRYIDKIWISNRWRSGNCTILRSERSRGITGQVRNLGIYWSEKYWGRGDYLYLTDADTYFTPGWLDTLIASIEDDRCRPVVKLLGGWNHPYMQPHANDQAVLPGYIVRSHDAVAGASQLMRWETYDKHGPFDAHSPGVGQSEDWAFCQKIIQAGGKVGSIYPRVVFNCGVTNSLGVLSPGADIMVEELKEERRKYPDLYWE